MDPVNNLNRVIEAMRQRLAARAGKGGEASRSAPTAAAAGASVASTALADIQRRVRERIRALNVADPRRDSKATRIFLELVLQRELGDEVANDPAFVAVIDEIQTQMEADPHIRGGLAELVTRLARESR